jgi:hypothetical protein
MRRSQEVTSGYTRSGGVKRAILRRMCRNIRVLHNFEPPTTPDEVRAAALQYVRKISGINKPTLADEKTFERAVDEVAAATTRVLAHLVARGTVRTREGEREKARARWNRRIVKMHP